MSYQTQLIIFVWLQICMIQICDSNFKVCFWKDGISNQFVKANFKCWWMDRRGVDYTGVMSPPLLISHKFIPRIFSGKCVCIKVFKTVWIKIDLNSKRQDNLCMTWCFIRTQNEARLTSRSAKHSLHAECVHSYSTQEGVLVQKMKFLIWTNVQLLLYENSCFHWKKRTSLELRLWQYMVYLCFSSHLQVVNVYLQYHIQSIWVMQC